MAGSAAALNVNRIVGQAFIAITRSDSARQHGANRTVAVTNRHNKGDFFPALKRRQAALNELMIERDIEAVVLAFGVSARAVRRGLIKYACEIQTVGFPMFDA